MKLHTVAVAMLASVSGMAMAGTNPVSIGAEIGTMGYGANLAFSATPSTEVIVGWNGNQGLDAKLKIDGEKGILGKLNQELVKDLGGQVRLGMTAKMNNPYVGVNIRPFSGSFTVGTGVVASTNNQIGVTVSTKDIDAPITINGTEYKLNSATAAVALKQRSPLAPYLTVGFRPNLTSNFGMSAEVGAVYVGKYDAATTLVDGSKVTAKLADGRSLAGDAAARQFSDDLDSKFGKASKLPIYPIAKVGLNVRF